MVKINIPLSKFIRHVGDLTVELSLGEIIDLLDASNNDNFLTKSIRDLEQKIFCSYEKFDKLAFLPWILAVTASFGGMIDVPRES